MKALLFLLVFAFSVCACAEEVFQGLQPSAITKVFEEWGCEVDERKGELQHEYHAVAKHSLGEVKISAFSPGWNTLAVTVISATALNLDGTESETNPALAEALAIVASKMPFPGSQSDKAARWVKANIHQNSSAVIGIAKYQIIANSPRARILRITPAVMAPSRQDAAYQENAPQLGSTFADVVKRNGKPRIQDPATGWAWWASFKARFEGGRVVEVTQ